MADPRKNGTKKERPVAGKHLTICCFGEKSITVVVDDAAEPAMRKLLDSIQFALGTRPEMAKSYPEPTLRFFRAKTYSECEELPPF